MTEARPAGKQNVRVDYDDLLSFVAAVFIDRGMQVDRARMAATALCYSDLVGQGTHGLANLTGLYLPLFDDARVDPGAEPQVLADRGAAVLVDAHRALGLWAASEAMDMAVERAATYGIGMISVRAATHFGCAGHHAVRAVRRGMVGIVASNCGRQRIVRPPGGQVTMLGTNPLSVAAPAGGHHPFVLDMSTTAVPAGRVREAARAGRQAPHGWLADDRGDPVTDPAAFDRGDAHLLWLGSGSGSGAYKGFGLGLMVEVLAALVSGAGLGPSREALAGDGASSGRDDDIGFLVAAIAPGALRPAEDVDRDAHALFDTLLACPPSRGNGPVLYPGWHEAERAHYNRRDGVPLAEPLYQELCDVAGTLGLEFPDPIGGD
ncbi:MAG: Ldh family oxidoreductase [Pseudonocardiaceae bacterium]|nr:Ldh family oxidoreductase [Pseudonocardiaceae bacterium]